MIDPTSIQISRVAGVDAIVDALNAALSAVDPEAAVRRTLSGHSIGSPDTVLALGKASPAMTRAALPWIEQPRAVIVVSDHREDVPGARLLIGSHPVPDQTSLAAGRELLEAASQASGILFLISGGGSALAEVPSPGLDLADVASVYRTMLIRGVPIEDANTVRAHLSAIKGGRLAATARGPVTTVAISDVGARPHLIASGPTVTCTTTPAAALEVLDRRNLRSEVPGKVISFLESATPPPPVGGDLIVAADGSLAAESACRQLAGSGFECRIITTELAGDASEQARWLLGAARPGEVTVAAGETTVDVRGPGIGGRNQEAALRAAVDIEGTETVFAALGTDGVDGPTDAAGAVVDGRTVGRIRSAGIDPEDALSSNDSHTALAAAGALIRTGPTGTNVADLWMVMKPPG